MLDVGVKNAENRNCYERKNYFIVLRDFATSLLFTYGLKIKYIKEFIREYKGCCYTTIFIQQYECFRLALNLLAYYKDYETLADWGFRYLYLPSILRMISEFHFWRFAPS